MFISVKRHEREKQDLIGASNRLTDAFLAPLLFFVAFISFALTGYSLGLSGSRALKLVLMLAALVAAVIILIVDLDWPRRGLILVSQQSMVELRQSLSGGSE